MALHIYVKNNPHDGYGYPNLCFVVPYMGTYIYMLLVVNEV